MGKYLNFIKEIQDAFELITEGTVKLNELAYSCEETSFKEKLIAYAVSYATLNYKLASYLLTKIAEAMQHDKDEEDFNDLMGGNFGK